MEKNIRQIFEKIYETSRAVKADTSKITESPVFIVALSSAMIA
jgi:hypothetical protein